MDLRSKRSIEEKHLDEYTAGDYNYYDPLLSPRVGVVNLEPPNDWIRSDWPRSWRLNLHSFRFADYWIKRYQYEGDLDRLRKLLSVVMNYIDQVWSNRNRFQGLEFVLSDVSVASRAAVIAYLLNQRVQLSLEEGVVDCLEATLDEHVKYAVDDQNYNSNNHGLFNDLHLLLSSVNCPQFDGLNRHLESILERFLKTFLERQISSEGIHLEHTPSYALLWLMIGRQALSILERLHCAGSPNIRTMVEEIKCGIEKVRDNLWWFLWPDGTLVNFGDQGHVGQPKILEDFKDDAGIRIFKDSGYAFYKEGESYLGLVAAYHATKVGRTGYRASSHKQRDELSLVWAESTVPILIDTGLRAYDYGPERRYTYTKQAHNCLSIDPFDFMKRGMLEYMNRTSPYGSGVIEVTCMNPRDAWVVLGGYDPLLQTQGVAHLRLLVYRKRRWLIVIDVIRLRKSARAEWNFHFDSRWRSAGFNQNGAQFKYGKCRLSVSRFASSEPRSPHVYLHRGEFEPVRGWKFEGDPVPVSNLRFIEWLSKQETHIRVSAFRFGSRKSKVYTADVTISNEMIEVDLHLEDDKGKVKFNDVLHIGSTLTSLFSGIS